jgi:small subunit ribosomal protein S16
LVKIRLRRMGAKKKPFYRVVVSDSRRTPTARVVESLGFYDPQKKPAALELDLERAKYWMGQGAQPSASVRTLIKRMRDNVA